MLLRDFAVKSLISN